MQKSKANILFSSTFTTSFITNDLHSLQKAYTVIPLIGSGIKIIIKYLKWIRDIDITFSWFASVYSSILIFLTKIFNKKSILVLGGADTAKEKEIGYGIWNSRWKSVLVKYAITHSTQVLAVDETLKKDAMKLCMYDGRNIKIIPTGFDPEYWKPSGEKYSRVLTVANCPDAVRIKIKGIDFLIQIAEETKDIQYTVVGVAEHLTANLKAPQNLKFIPFLPQGELLIEYQKSKIYFQPSYREGLPNALCEAMLCECCPVGTRIGGIPTAIGNTGKLIEYGNVEEGCTAIIQVIKEGNGKPARQRISKMFLKEMREKQLNSIIESFDK